ncbi:N-acetylmuramic acid 6-phosphate etherase [Aliagarivorans taiwanensis]|uniref:N-acetylmuramic acid 6-phosphate etherase n=1 Tax=Aliagarivorans taiwanensis TaxID=561966 RepID=UPI00041DE6E8|nr:N-acetylmuramic acid 6-phosphate etherase [Aliagarivorans taiwanensis]
MSELLNQLASLVSEGRNPETMDIDQLDSLALVSKLNQQDRGVADAVAQCLPAIAEAVDKITEAFRCGGRLIYIGAGTSGRLGVLDASECPPTFGVDENTVIGLIAGGEQAMFRAQEGAEDSLTLAQSDLQAIALTGDDVLVGIAASGRTPYVLGGLAYAESLGATTVALSCNPDSAIADAAAISIAPVVGPEALTGSTRLKAGTAQKLVLNMLSTASMIRWGKSYQNLMVDLKATNEKLQARAQRIVMQACQCPEGQAYVLLEQAQFDTKLAIMIGLSGLAPSEAKVLLANNHGVIRQALRSN